MIKFFRKIRHSLLSENKLGKYLIYALGEIILVVIGILIALQINNRHQAKQDRAFEIKMLSEIRNALISDKLCFEEMYGVMNNLKETSRYFMELSKTNVAYHDTLLPKIFELNENISYEYNIGPYEALKSSGMDKISNDSIRILLTNLYDFKFPQLETSVAQITYYHKNNIEEMLLLLGERYVFSLGGRNRVGWNNVPKDLFQKQGFLQILAGVEFRGRVAGRKIKKFIPNISAVIEILNKEIEE